jgi:D-alanyl-D-alanine dipeptidase
MRICVHNCASIQATGPIAWLLMALVVFSLAVQVRPALSAPCSSKAPEAIVIAIDVGHTATNVGATSARGIGEYEFNLKLAQRVREELLGAGFRSTSLMVTALNGHSGLNQRAARANGMNADIFISIHHDGVRDKYLKPWLYEDKQHFFFDDSTGFSLHVSPRYDESLRLARIIADQLMASGLHFTTSHEPNNPVGARVPYLDSSRGIYRRDNLVILKHASMPAVLLEAGVIVNRDEELVVSTPAYQGIVATAVTEAVKKFCMPPEAPAAGTKLPKGFVYLADIDPGIRQDIRYAGLHNFVGRPVEGYLANECVLTEKAAHALSQVQAELAAKKLSLIVWDCYRPARAVSEFIAWSKTSRDIRMKAEFFPNTNKAQLFALGYLSSRSAHSRGSTVDLGIVPADLPALSAYDPTASLKPCTAAKAGRFEDGTIDLGTGYDCLDPLAITASPHITAEAMSNRKLLQELMRRFGFKPYSREWWHFELADEPFPQQRFDFPVIARALPPAVNVKQEAAPEAGPSR